MTKAETCKACAEGKACAHHGQATADSTKKECMKKECMKKECTKKDCKKETCKNQDCKKK